jgi:hypothetical protein
MDKIYNIIGTSTKVRIKKGHIDESSADVMINWTKSDLRSGPPPFLRLHRAAGPELFNSVLDYEVNMAVINECDCFTTKAGMLNAKMVIHSVMPLYQGNYLKAFLHIAATMKVYMANNLCRNLVLYIPEHPSICLAGVKEFLLDLGLEEVIILYLTDNEFTYISSFFHKFQVKLNLWEYMSNMSDRVLAYLGRLDVWEGIKKMFQRS